MRPAAGVAISFVAAAMVVLVAPSVGHVPLDMNAVLNGVEPDATVFFRLRMPRVLLGALAGGLLAIAGRAFQTLLRNDLATPFTLGVASGASLGAVLAMSFGVGLVAGLSPVPLAAFAGAAAVVLSVQTMAESRQGANTSTLLLGGVTISLFCSALILLMQFLSDFTATQKMIRWMMGGLDVVGYDTLLYAGVPGLVGAVWLAFHAPDLDMLYTGDALAAARGLNLRRTRRSVVLAASLCAAAVIAFVGPIGFVGLIVPHAMQRLVGPRHVWSLPACFFGGAAFLPLCDTAARMIIAPTELPVGVLTGLLGSPFFLFILMRRR